MKLMRTLLWAMVLIPALLSAQPSQEEARKMARMEASRQGVDPDALEARLQARGINTATLTMTDIPRVQPIVEEEIAKDEGGAIGFCFSGASCGKWILKRNGNGC